MLPTLSLVLPCFNEEENIEDTVREVFAWFKENDLQGEAIIVNDGSSDGTATVLHRLQEEFSLVVLTHRENQGYGAALCAGCDRATMELIAFMDSDGQFHASDFMLLLPRLSRVDFASGVRVRRADPFMRSLNARLYGWLIRWILGIRARDINCAMKVFRRTLWPTIRPQVVTGALFNAELFLRLMRARISWEQVPVPHYPRLLGTPTGAQFCVIVRMFRELWKLRCSKTLPSQEYGPSHSSHSADPKKEEWTVVASHRPIKVRSM